MDYSYEDDEDLRLRIEEEGVGEVTVKYIEAMKKLMFLEEIVEESETDSHWTNRVEWVMEDADSLIQDFKSYLDGVSRRQDT